jgi:hypothetical protein
LIDFETPSLGADQRQIINPYVDTATGLTFTAEPEGFGDEVVGLVKNSATSACVEPPNDDQKLGTGRSGEPGGAIGLAGFPIRATFPTPLDPLATVSVEFQTKAGATLQLKLLDASGAEVASVTDTALPADGTCGYPGDPRARKTVTATSTQPVAFAIMDVLPMDGTKLVFVIDNFEAASGSLTISSSYTSTPPSIDGMVGFGEWQISNETRLYVLVDVLDDTADDTGDYFWLTFDVDEDNAITSNVDLNYGTVPGTGNMRYQFYLGPGQWTGLLPDIRSSKAKGFGCFFADGSLTFAWPFIFTCSNHRLWEFGIDLAEIGAEAGDTVRMGLRVSSPNPSFTDDTPADFFNDFTKLIEVSLAPPPTPIPPANPSASIGLETNAIELTQAIQDRPNTLPLAANKQTVARMYVDVDGVATAQPAVVYLYGNRGGIDLPGSPLSILFMAPTTIDREQLNDTANFLLPRSWDDEGTVEFQGRVLDLFGNEVSSTPFNLAFTTRDIPVYWVVPINTGTAAAPSLVSNAEISSQQSYLQTVYPVPRVRFVRRSWQAIGPTTVGNTIKELNDYYDSALIAWVISVLFTGEEPFELPDQIYGFTPSGGGISDPVWAGGRGRVARGFRGTSREATMAHEINHNLDRSLWGTWGRHTPFDCSAGGPDPDWPFTNDDIQEVGFDTRLPWVDGTGIRDTVIPANYPDFMSYCQSDDLPGNPAGQLPTKWIATYRWNSLSSHAFSAISLSLAELTAQIQTVYYVSGQVNVDGTGSLEPIVVQPGLPTEEIAPGDYSIEVQDAAGEPLLITPIFVSFINVEGEEVETVYFNFQLPEQPGASKIVLKHGDQILDVIAVSENPPTVTVLAPNGGESWDGLQTIQWSADDPDGEPLSFTILYTPDDGNSWFPVAGNVQEYSHEVDTSVLPGGEAARIRVITTDGFNTVHDDSDGTFTAAAQAPKVDIILPEDNEQFASGELISFRGDATDPDDGSLPDESFIWSYDTTFFGMGRDVDAVLPDGVHEVTLTVVDSQDYQATDTITVFVGVPAPQNSSIEIRKEATDDSTVFNFTFNGESFSLKNSQSTVFSQLAPARYTIIETVPDEWLLHRISCDNGFSAIDPELPEVTIDLQPDEHVACTFTNEWSTAIELSSFTAKAGPDDVTLTWETSSELDNEGFNVWRSEAADGQYTKLNATLIPAQGTADTGARYDYTDTDVVKGVTYYYQLEDVDIHGVSTFHGPVSATPLNFRPIWESPASGQDGPLK